MKSILITLLIATPIFSFSQTGPGGIGATDGISNLIFWLKADAGVEEASSDAAEDTDPITTWLDQSGVGNNAITVTAPTFETNQYNGFPAVNFDGVDDVLSMDGSLLPLGTSARTYIIVAQAIETGGQNVMSHGKETIRQRISITHSSTESSLAVGGCNWGDQFTAATGLRTNTITFPSGGGSNSFNMFTNAGPLVESYIAGGFYSVNTYPDYAYIGSNILVNDFFGGDICEIIVFDKVLNSAEFIIIHNYLSAKYNLPVAVNDIYVQDNSGNGNYDYDVAGIGRVNVSNETLDGQGSGIVRILNPSGLGDNEFLLWGHDNGSSIGDETTDIPAGMDARLGRLWRANEVNASGGAVDVGSIDVQFDLTGLGAVTASDLRLLVDTDNDGVFTDETAISGAISVGANVYSFVGVSAITNNSRFTLGTIDNVQTPLPIELVNFNVEVEENTTVQLSWQTVSESNNEQFKIEKSLDGKQWDEVSIVSGAGNSIELINYHSYDPSPFIGRSYYRLVQSDYSGRLSYSEVKTAFVEDLEAQNVELYPNPTSGLIALEGSERELSELKIFNCLGTEVTNLVREKSNQGSKRSLDISNLPTGIYWIKTRFSVNRVVKQ